MRLRRKPPKEQKAARPSSVAGIRTPSALTVFRLMAGPMRSGLMSQSDQSRRFDDAPITSGLPLINGYHQTRSAGPVRAMMYGPGRALQDRSSKTDERESCNNVSGL